MALAIMLLGTLVTDDPTYRSTAMPAPDPASLTTTNTDYAAAATITRQALRLLDDNDDFDQARGSDPLWPTAAEATAVQALRDLCDEFTARSRSALQPAPPPCAPPPAPAPPPSGAGTAAHPPHVRRRHQPHARRASTAVLPL
ncbi:hypothetical protein [Streptomyces agglomeratus]|uniref:hypothetical protein n=1 Tax=Streptomyces agglomeratus TaxID=285458 RepID=UPI00085463EE|nr:hypothetical protein [Streptomyces agglomeratus]OEJ49526.1 hypothetical protein BGK72_00530 [Streptomyces agglomeratus]